MIFFTNTIFQRLPRWTWIFSVNCKFPFPIFKFITLIGIPPFAPLLSKWTCRITDYCPFLSTVKEDLILTPRTSRINIAEVVHKAASFLSCRGGEFYLHLIIIFRVHIAYGCFKTLLISVIDLQPNVLAVSDNCSSTYIFPISIVIFFANTIFQ